MYKLFIPPNNYFAKEPREWSKKEVKDYSDWFLKAKPERVTNFRAVMEIHEDPLSEDDWEALSNRFYEMVVGAEFSKEEDYTDPLTGAKRNNRIFTNQGFALAADMGLFLFDVIERHSDKKLEWSIGKGPKGYVSHNQPVVIDNDSDQLDPVEIGITTTLAIINGNTTKNRWYSKFKAFQRTL